jgi:SAM-dependent methyltransferase
MTSVLSSLEKRLVALDKKTFYRWLRQGMPGSAFPRYAGGYIFWFLYAGRPYVGTRVAEIPWVMKRLKEHGAGKCTLLIVGDVLTQKLAGMGYGVDLVDMDAEASAGKNLRVQKLDIREAKLPAAGSDLAIAISTVEHIGVQGIEFPDGDRLAMGIIHRALKPGGLLLLTVPFGKAHVVKGFTRVYDRQSLLKILSEYFTVEEETYRVWNGIRWKRAPVAAVETAGFLRNDPEKYKGQNLGLAMVMAKNK